MDDERIIYSLCIADIQAVAEAEYGRRLSKEELAIVEDRLGDYVKWYDLIDLAISNHIDGISHNAPSHFGR